MYNQDKLEEVLCSCPVCKDTSFIEEQQVEMDENAMDPDISAPIISKYWIALTCTCCNVTWGFCSWTGDPNEND